MVQWLALLFLLATLSASLGPTSPPDNDACDFNLDDIDVGNVIDGNVYDGNDDDGNFYLESFILILVQA